MEPGKQRPFGTGKGANFFLRKRSTAARRRARRASKGKRSGRRSWMRDWPRVTTQKGGKNKGAAPRYSDKPYVR